MSLRSTATGSSRAWPSRAGRSLAVVLVVLVAGCTGTLVEFEASPATIPDDAVEAQGYVHGNTTEVPVTYPVGVAGVSRNVTARTWLSGYSRTTVDGDVAGLLLFSSPNVEVAGQSVNPLAQLSNRGLVGFVLARATDLRTLGGVEDVSDLREVGARNVTVLGTSTELVTYTGVASLDGGRMGVGSTGGYDAAAGAAASADENSLVGVVVHLAVVEHGDDVVVALAVHDESMDETDRVAALVERIEHDEGAVAS